MEPSHLSLLQSDKDELGIPTWKDYFESYSHLIDSWLQRRGLQIHDIEDIRQEVLVIVIRELPHYQQDQPRGAFRASLRQLTANRLRKFLRESSRRSEWLDVGAFADQTVQIEDMSNLLSRMWDIDHDRVVLSKFLDKIKHNFNVRTIDAFQRITVAEENENRVAKDLGMTINAVRIAQSRVLKTLRQLAGELID